MKTYDDIPEFPATAYDMFKLRSDREGEDDRPNGLCTPCNRGVHARCKTVTLSLGSSRKEPQNCVCGANGHWGMGLGSKTR